MTTWTLIVIAIGVMEWARQRKVENPRVCWTCGGNGKHRDDCPDRGDD